MIPPRDLVLVAVVILAWGSNFSAMKLALEQVPPILFVGLRFAILVPLIVFFRRPAGWPAILAVGALINMGQFMFLFSGLAAGSSAGLASLIIQSQVPMTIVLAWAVYGERITLIQGLGIGLAALGLAGFGLASGGNITVQGLGLILCGALCWAVGNLVLRRLPGTDMLALFLWASLVPPLPMLGLSLLTETGAPWATITAISPAGWAAVIYVAVISTLLGYSIWGTLLSRHPAALITPFALMIPVVGVATAALVLGERVALAETVAGLVVLAGLCLAVFGQRYAARRAGRRRPPAP
ncbi:EamA family transporter [Roseicyclus mahoneyensis]|uniref:O-acetylserine/cysteine efflux transporter n=1 Tax=Roseicyclus mahoneyensis TaxID=164332 RepID=A0A316GMS7_9RHOB|nr:EamA family transporter [Roseicyclus mahoneyensis]PWK62224.1 O-acetylserine/cysteine efflux transporter [Roseicyclus mahoneyensis]